MILLSAIINGNCSSIILMETTGSSGDWLRGDTFNGAVNTQLPLTIAV